MKTFGCRYYDRSRSVLAIHTSQTRAFRKEGGGNFDDFIELRMRAFYTSGLYLGSSEPKCFEVEMCER